MTERADLTNLPSSWDVRRLDELADIVSGGTPSKARSDWWSGTVPWVSPKDMKRPRLHDATDHITEEAAQQGSRMVPAKTVFLVVRGMILAKNVPVAITERPMAFNQDMKAIIAYPGVNPDFLFYAIRARAGDLASEISTSAHGTRRMGSFSVESLRVPLPRDQREQNAIVGLLARLESAALVQQLALSALNELKAGTMTRLFREDLFGGEALRATEIDEQPSSWRVEAIGSHFSVGNGSTPSRQNPGYWTGGSLPWLTSKRVHDTIIRAADEYVTHEAKRDCHLPLVPSGSLVIAITGQGKTLGNVAKVTFDTFVNQHLAYLKPTGTKVNPDFLLAYLQTRYQDLRRAASAGGSTKGALTCGFLAGYRFPLPPLHEQEQIAGLWRRLTDRLETADSRRTSSVALFETALEALMSGELRVTPLLGGG
jgi:type I restriction enzyme S subunit